MYETFNVSFNRVSSRLKLDGLNTGALAAREERYVVDGGNSRSISRAKLRAQKSIKTNSIRIRNETKMNKKLSSNSTEIFYDAFRLLYLVVC